MDGSGSMPIERAAGGVRLVCAALTVELSTLDIAAMRAADAVIHDAAIAGEVLALVPAGRLIQPAPRGERQADERCRALARAGWRVVRLVAEGPRADCRSFEETEPRLAPAAHATDFSMVGIAG
jgi:siroheme synthase